MAKLNPREKVLAAIVGGTVLILVNYFVLTFFFGTEKKLRLDTRSRALQLETMEKLMANTGSWQQRDAWLKGKQPVLENEATAGVQLLSQVQDLARRHSVTIEQPVIANPDRQAQYTAVSLTFETKSTWESLIRFLHALQGPEEFLVLDSLNLRIDGQDQTRMRGQFRISKWFAP